MSQYQKRTFNFFLLSLTGIVFLFPLFTNAEKKKITEEKIQSVKIRTNPCNKDFTCGLIGKEQTIAILDYQINPEHHQFMEWDNITFDPAIINGWITKNDPEQKTYKKDFIGIDYDGHGTHVAGILVGKGTKIGSGRTEIDSEEGGEGITKKMKIFFQPLAAPVQESLRGNPTGKGNVQCFGKDLYDKTGKKVVSKYTAIGVPDISLEAYLAAIKKRNDDYQTHPEDKSRIINLSIGDCNARKAYEKEARYLDATMWDQKNHLIVVAAGEENGAILGSKNAAPREKDTLNKEARAKNVLTVGAIDTVVVNKNPSPKEDPFLKSEPIEIAVYESIAAFSGRGNPIKIDGKNAFNQRVKPDVAAPGSYILSVRSHHCLTQDGKYVEQPRFCTGLGLPLKPTEAGKTEELNHDYLYLSGTGQATALVSGAAALAREYFIRQDIKNHSTPSGALIKASLLHKTQRLRNVKPDGSPADLIPLNQQGWGRINLNESLFPNWGYADPEKIGEIKYVPFGGRHTMVEFVDTVNAALDPRVNLSIEKFFRFSKAYGPVEITLVWTDPATEDTGKLINNIDLEVTAPNGEFYHGNVFVSGKKDLASKANPDPGSRDNVNTVEKVIIPEPEDGKYTLQVSVDLKQWSRAGGYDTQPFALIASPVIGVDNTKGPQAVYQKNKEDIKFTAQGLPPSQNVKVHVVKHHSSLLSSFLNAPFANPVVIPKHMRVAFVSKDTNAQGKISEAVIWPARTQRPGLYNLIVDVNGNSKYDPSVDVVDFYSSYGFQITKKRVRLEAATSEQSVDKGVQRDFSIKKRKTIYFRGYNLDSGKSSFLYLIKHDIRYNFLSNTPIALKDVRGAPTPVTITQQGNFKKPVQWNTKDQKAGIYNLVLDVNKDGFFKQADGDVIGYPNEIGFTVVDNREGHNEIIHLGDNGIEREVYNSSVAHHLYTLVKNLPRNKYLDLYIISQKRLKEKYPSWAGWRNASNIDLIETAIPINVRSGSISIESLTIDDKIRSDRSSPEGTLFLSSWQKPSDLLNATVRINETNSSSFLEYYGKIFNVVLDINQNGVFDQGDKVDVYDIGHLQKWFDAGHLELSARNGNGDDAVGEYKEFLNSKLSLLTSLSGNNEYNRATEQASYLYTCLKNLTEKRFQNIITPGAEIGFQMLPKEEYLQQKQFTTGRYRYIDGHIKNTNIDKNPCIIADNLILSGKNTIEKNATFHTVSKYYTFCYTRLNIASSDYTIVKTLREPFALVFDVIHTGGVLFQLEKPCEYYH